MVKHRSGPKSIPSKSGPANSKNATTIYDQAPKSNNENIKNDTPKRFQYIIKRAQMVKDGKISKKNLLDNTKNKNGLVNLKKNLVEKNATLEPLSKLPGEKNYDFQKRLDDSVRKLVNKATRSEFNKVKKRKTWLKEQKLKKKKGVNKKEDDDNEDEDNDKNFSKQKDGKLYDTTIKFGQVVQAPPQITVIPRKIGGGGGTNKPSDIEKLKQLLSKSSNDNEETSNETTPTAPMENTSTKQQQTKNTENKVGRKMKLKLLPLSEKKKLEDERKRVIGIYRDLKSKKDVKLPNYEKKERYEGFIAK